MFVESVLVLSGLVNGYYIIFGSEYIFKFPLPELWRLVSSFLLTGGGFNFVFDLYFSISAPSCNGCWLTSTVWIYGTGLELNSPRFSQPGDFFTYVLFCAAVIIVSENPSLCPPFALFQHLAISARPAIS